MTQNLYRGGDSSDDDHQWWTTDRGYAEFYARGGTVHESRVHWSRTLDLRPFGVDLDPEALEAFVDELGIPAYVPGTDEIEIHQVVEDRDFHEAVFRCGYRAIRCLQWHHDFDEEPVDSWFVCCD